MSKQKAVRSSAPAITAVHPEDALPLTCSRRGVCCHNKAIWLNPWELEQLAQAAGLSPRLFRDRHTEGGVRLNMDGPAGWRGQPACCLYDLLSGCRAHTGRPLACRLYPLGRRVQNGKVEYLFEGNTFPCLDGCPEVEGLPRLTLAEYLAGQQTADGIAAQEVYLEIMQDLAEGALVLLIDSGLARSGDRQTLPLWQKLAKLTPQERASHLPAEWYDRLTLSEEWGETSNTPPAAFGKQHRDALQKHALETFARLNTPEALREASGLMFALALQLGAGLGITAAALAERWIQTARAHGARS